MRINLLSHDNGVGLTQDMKIVKAILKEHRCATVDIIRGQEAQKADINIFFEILDRSYYKTAPVNLFFPNPEWFNFQRQLKGIDLVMCKTHEAEHIFKRISKETVYTSFTSEDRYKKFEPTDNHVYLHTAGQSTAKGTATIWQSWEPTYPELIFCKLKDYDQYAEPKDNIYTCFNRIPNEVLVEMQNRCVFHLCPSEAEGFGHYIWEAKSCGGIVITTNAGAMKEMVKDGVDGFLVNTRYKRRHNFGMLHMIDREDFKRVIEKTMRLTEKEIKQMRSESRYSWEMNDKYFRTKLREVIKRYE